MSTEPLLNPPQAEAVAHTRGPLLVFAGAGSGKTRVITYRIANLVAREHVPPYRILAVTFTNKAAAEMRARLSRPELLGDIARDLWVGTFHATCAKLLRIHADAAERTKSFVIYDASDQKAVVTRALRELDLDEKRYAPKAMLARIHKEKQEARGPDEMSRDSYIDDAVARVYEKYEAHLRASNALDFEDLILHTVRILEAGEDVAPEVRIAREALRKKYEYVLVDEFQDTNATQYRLLRAFSARTNNLCVVGDDDQSIYRWRGADVRNIRGFQKDYPDARVVKLEQNYRSSKNIVTAALAVIAPSPTREPKDLWTDKDEGTPVRVVTVADERDEAACVLRVIRDARDSGISPREIAVFYRVHAQSRVLEEGLRAVGMQYQIVGGMKFYERAEIKDALAYLRVLVNPRSDVDLQRIINVPARGIGNTTVERLIAVANQHGVSLMEAIDRLDALLGDEPAGAPGEQLGLDGALAPRSKRTRKGRGAGDVDDASDDGPQSGASPLGAAARKRVGQVRALFRVLAEEARGRPPADVLRMVLAKSGYREALARDGSTEAEARLENLAELESSMQDYALEAEASGESPTLEGYLERVSLQSDVDNVGEDERITLMTVHAAKGLEFDLVILTGMEEDIFPYRTQEGRSAEEMDEERRLAYVAVTRAKQHLVITHARQRQIFGTTRIGIPSRFVGDLPPGVVDLMETPAARASSSAGRYIDRGADSHVAPTSWRGGASGGWRHPQSAPRARADEAQGWESGERFVEREPIDDGDGVAVRPGMTVVHERFGRGEVKKVVSLGEPAVVAFFPAWGEKKVLLRFLKMG